jgi:hypothetical protein
MSCCGSKRQQQFPLPPRPAATNSGISSVPTGVPGRVQQTVMFFTYEGETALTVTGRATGRRYRFPHAGARVAVDMRDVPGMRGVAVLRRT